MEKFKELFRILFMYDPALRLDLFASFPLIRQFYKNRHNLALLRSFGDIAFTCLILLGLFGPQDPGRNISLFLAWGVWWSGVVLSWFFLGKFWCGVCPFQGIGRLLQRFGLCLNLDPPHALRRYFVHIAVFLFAVIIWAEAVTDMKHWPLGTALLLLSILLGATIMGFMYKGQAWCRYICPLGKIIGAGSTMSMIELRSDLSLCRTCRSFACKKGRGNLRGCPIYLGAHNVKNNQDCLLCGRCVLLCENDSPRILLRNPFVELVAGKNRDITFSFIIPFLAGSQWARFINESQWYQSLQLPFFFSTGVSFFLLLAVCFAAFLGIIKLGNRLMGCQDGKNADHFSPMVPILIPLAFSGELVYRLQYLLSEAGQFPVIFGRQFGYTLERFSFEVPEGALMLLSVILLVLGGLGSLYAARLVKHNLQNVPASAFFIVLILLCLADLVYLLLIL
jgi:hypothetical protein